VTERPWLLSVNDLNGLAGSMVLGGVEDVFGEGLVLEMPDGSVVILGSGDFGEGSWLELFEPELEILEQLV